MTQHELAFRHVAANDFHKFRPRRNPAEIAILLDHRGVVDSGLRAACVNAYDDEYRCDEAEELGLCRHCKTSAPMHWHTESMVRDGRIILRGSVCSSRTCTERPSHVGTVCNSCREDSIKIALGKRNAKTRRLLANRASVPGWMVRWLERAA